MTVDASPGLVAAGVAQFIRTYPMAPPPSGPYWARSWHRALKQRPGLLAWTREARLFSVAGDGRIYATDDAARAWKRLATAGAQPAAVATDARGDLYIAVGEGTVLNASNSGRQLSVRDSGTASWYPHRLPPAVGCLWPSV